MRFCKLPSAKFYLNWSLTLKTKSYIHWKINEVGSQIHNEKSICLLEYFLRNRLKLDTHGAYTEKCFLNISTPKNGQKWFCLGGDTMSAAQFSLTEGLNGN